MKKKEKYLHILLEKPCWGTYLWAVLLLPPAIYFLSMVGYWFGMPMSPAHALIALTSLAGAAAFRTSLTHTGKFFLACRVGLFTLFYLTLVVSVQTWFVDVSWDGRQYHAEAISQLKLGWNPVYERLLPDQRGYGDPSIWLNVLPKFTWVIGASVYAITEKISSTKILSLYYLIPVSIYAYALIRPHLERIAALAISLLVVVNPVVLSQVFTNYIDGPAYLILVTFALSLIDLHQKSEVRIATPWFVLLFAISALAVKFTNIVPVSIILMGGLVLSARLRLSISRLNFIVPAIILTIAVLYNPYVTNLVRYGNIAYPIYNKPFTKNVIFPLNVAPDGVGRLMYDSNHGFLSSQSPIKALAQSIFSYSANDNSAVQLKFPLAIRKSEWLQFGNPDVRVGGFGPFYSAGLIFGIVGLLIAFKFNRLNRRRLSLVFGCFLLVGITVITPNSWWSRYVPYLWLVPIILAAITLERLPSKRTWLPRLALLSLMFNVLGIAAVVTVKNFQDSNFSNGPFFESLKQQVLIAPLQIKCDFNRDLIDYREKGLPFYCTQLSREVFNAYSLNYSDKISLEHLYEVKVNDAAYLLNSCSHLESIPFYGEVMSLKSNIQPGDKENLVTFYKVPLRYSVQTHPPLVIGLPLFLLLFDWKNTR